LIEGKFELDDIYAVVDEDNIEENADVKDKIKVSIFDDLVVDVHKIFKWWFD